MGKTFDELFDDFFKSNNINPLSHNQDNISNSIKDDAQRMMDILASITRFRNSEIDNVEENIDKHLEQELQDFEKEFDDSLGKPDKIEFYDENGFYFEKRIWNTPHGDIEKIIVSDDPTLISYPKPEKSLNTKLAEAVEAEDYELASKIRDEINEKKKTKK